MLSWQYTCSPAYVFVLRNYVWFVKSKWGNIYVGQEPYTVEGQLYVSCIQRGGSLVWADDRSKIIKASVDFDQKAFVLE